MDRESQLEAIAEQVRRQRTDRGWTLDVAASRLKISRRLLALIEAGDANPSLSTLLSIAAGFEMPLVDLLAGDREATVTVQVEADAPVLWSGSSGGWGRLLVASGGLELWDWLLEPGEEHRSEAHRPGTREALSVRSGAVTLRLGAGEPTVVRRGQSAAFRAEEPHRYCNETSRAARFMLAVYEAD